MPSVVLHIPHSSVEVPPDLRGQLCLSDEELRRELLRMTDWYTDELFYLPEEVAQQIRYPVSRLVLDPERFLDDELETMAPKGMGVIYTKTAEGTPLRKAPAAGERESLIDRYYRPHHNALADAVDAALRRHGRCLIIDCHSFPALPLPYEEDQSLERPEICIGTDACHTPAWLTALGRWAFEKAGFTVAIDRPFSGALVPERHYRKAKAVHSIMIEIRRDLYMDEDSGRKTSDFEPFVSRCRSVLGHLAKGWHLGDNSLGVE